MVKRLWLTKIHENHAIFPPKQVVAFGGYLPFCIRFEEDERVSPILFLATQQYCPKKLMNIVLIVRILVTLLGDSMVRVTAKIGNGYPTLCHLMVTLLQLVAEQLKTAVASNSTVA